MNPNRILAGWSCLMLAFMIIVLLATGFVDPPGLRAARSMSDLASSLVPFLVAAAGLFGMGMWLIRGPKRR